MFWYIWLFLFLAFLGVEIMTTGVFFFLCFSLGALFAMTFSLLGSPEYVSIIIFFAVSLASIFFIRPLAKKFLDKKKIDTNIDSLIGAPAVVIEKITVSKAGKVKVAGEIWLASSTVDIEADENVKIVSVSGTKLIVEK